MKHQNRGKFGGFTLIELLVVVLIIGILAAVAVPQYQKAVDISRTKAVWLVMRHVKDAENVYKLANGNYTKNFSELGIDLPIKGYVNNSPSAIELVDGTMYSLDDQGTFWHVLGAPRGYFVLIYLALPSTTTLCYPLNTARGRAVCKALGCSDASGTSCSFEMK